MNTPENSPFHENPFPDPFEDHQPSQAMEAAERLKQAADNNVKRLQKAAEAGYRSFQSSDIAEESETTAGNETSTASWEEIQEKLKELHRESEEWARKNPTAALLTAAGAGFILGLLLKS